MTINKAQPAGHSDTLLSRSQNDQNLWALIELCSDLYWQENSNYCCVELRGPASDLAGFPLLGATLWELGCQLLTPRSEEPISWVTHIAARDQRETFRDLLCRVPQEDGGSRYLNISGQPQFSDTGVFTGYHCVARDVTRQRANQTKLNRFRAAVDASGDLVYLVDRATMRFIDVNDTACKAARLTRHELLQMGPHDILPGSKEEIAANYDAIIATESQRRVEVHTTGHRGEAVVFEVFSRSACIDGQWVIISISRNITARKQAEENSTRLGKMFAALSATNAAILRATSVENLYQRACDAAVEGANFSVAMVLEVDPEGWLRPSAASGHISSELMEMQVSVLDGRPEGQGLTGAAFRTLKPAISNDFLNDQRSKFWRDLAEKKGARSGAALPLLKSKKPIGVLLLYSEEKDAFDKEHVALLSSMAENISFALDNFQREVERKAAEQVLRESEERFRSLTHLSSDFFWVQDQHFRFTAYEGKVSGESNRRAVADLIGRTLWELDNVAPLSMNWKCLRQVLARNEMFRDFEFSFTNDDNVTYYFSLSGEPIFDDAGAFAGYRGIARDVTQRKLASDRIQYLATHDYLTALPNRVLFSELINQAIKNAARYKRNFAVLFLDLDGFKEVNDSHGHHVGDELLKEVAERLQQPLRKSDVVARMGGDEFVVLLQEVSTRRQIARVAENLLRTFSEVLLVGKIECRITASIGISIFGKDATDEDTLMKQADNAMYAAKARGKDTFQFYSEGDKLSESEPAESL